MICTSHYSAPDNVQKRGHHNSGHRLSIVQSDLWRLSRMQTSGGTRWNTGPPPLSFSFACSERATFLEELVEGGGVAPLKLISTPQIKRCGFGLRPLGISAKLDPKRDRVAPQVSDYRTAASQNPYQAAPHPCQDASRQPRHVLVSLNSASLALMCQPLMASMSTYPSDDYTTCTLPLSKHASCSCEMAIINNRHKSTRHRCC